MQTSMRPARNIRREQITPAGRFRGGKLVPVNAHPFRQGEGGTVSQSMTFELEPIAGRMITPITLEVTHVFVPALALDAIKNPGADYPGNAEIFRERLVQGEAVFGLENESIITQKMGLVPIQINGVKKINEAARLSYIAAVNYLRRRKYVNAAQLLNTTATITPALIGDTVLDRLGGVLDPEDRVDGFVRLGLPDKDLRVRGIGVHRVQPFTSIVSSAHVRETGGQTQIYAYGTHPDSVMNNVVVQTNGPSPGTAEPMVFAELLGAETDGFSLADLTRAEIMDRIVRGMRQVVDANPQHGEGMVARMAAGLRVETDKQPFVLSQVRRMFGMSIQPAMDGPSLGQRQTNMAVKLDLTLPVPSTELGGVLVTLVAVKPDETLASQPHPVFAEPWTAPNYFADEMAIEPVPVRIREINADCLQADENTIALYTGNHGLKRTYVHYGFTRDTDLETVEAKTALWQLQVPMSVTPESVIYPDDIDHYPFALNLPTDDVCTYTVQSSAVIATPLIFGPSPVEELAIIEDEDLFEDAPE